MGDKLKNSMQSAQTALEFVKTPMRFVQITLLFVTFLRQYITSHVIVTLKYLRKILVPNNLEVVFLDF